MNELDMNELEKMQTAYGHFTGKAFSAYLKSVNRPWFKEIHEIWTYVRELTA